MSDPLRLLISGSRTILSQDVVSTCIEKWLAQRPIMNKRRAARGLHLVPVWPSELVHGDCYGVDRKADWWAAQHGIKRYPFPANWEQGRKAGPIRNRHMAEYADELLAIWDGVSRGTSGTVAIMRGLGKPAMVIQVMPSSGSRAVPELIVLPDPPQPPKGTR